MFWGVEPVLGRLFAPEEFGVAGAAVAVVGYGYGQSRLGGELDLSDVVVRVRDAAVQIVGVMPPGYSFPAGTAPCSRWPASAAASSWPLA